MEICTVFLHLAHQWFGKYVSDNFWINSLCQNSPAGSYVVNNLVQCRSLDLLALEVCHGVHEVEPDTALPQLPDEELLLL